jgi:hypothetical protein
MLAKFDGKFHVIGNFTYLEFRTLQQVKFETERGPFFNKEHSVTGEAIKIFKKKDRGTILLLSETAKNLQILQVKLSWFDSNDPVAFGQARTFLTDIAELYVADKLKKEELVAHRDKVLQEKFGVSPEPRGMQAKAGSGTDSGKDRGKGRGKGCRTASVAKVVEASSSSSAAPPAKKAKASAKLAAKSAAKSAAPGKAAPATPKLAAPKLAAKSAAPEEAAPAAAPLEEEAPCTPPRGKKAKLSFGEPPGSINELLAGFEIDA